MAAYLLKIVFLRLDLILERVYVFLEGLLVSSLLLRDLYHNNAEQVQCRKHR